MRVIRVGRLAVVALITGMLPVVYASTASAAGTPNVTLSEQAPTTVLYGSPASVTLTAKNPDTVPGYNASFKDVLPAGVSYVAGSTTPGSVGDPQVLTDEPGSGQTTLIWANVSDIQPAASTSITFQVQPAVEPASDALLPGASYTDNSSVYVDTNPRVVPTFNTSGVADPATYTGSDTSSGTTLVDPLELTKSQAEPEAELPRGVHDHKDLYTLTATNSSEDATNNATVTDYLPAGLEFLGCGTTDNTTNAAGTNPGSADEYPGSGPLGTGQSDTSATCLTPASVSTVQLASSGGNGSQPAQPIVAGTSTYTKVVWDIGNLAPKQSKQITYLAAVPLRENAAFTGTAPSDASGAQGSNLDNNTGPETADGQNLTNLGVVAGTYTGPVAPGSSSAVSASGTQTVEAVDLAIQKTDSQSDFVGGDLHTYTLHYETSEYRYSTGVTITDNLPNGMCPIGSQNYDPNNDPECAPQGGAEPSVPYTSVAETADGGFHITWDLSTLPTNTDTSITFPAVDRSSYQSGGSSSTPTLSEDSFVNTTSITGTALGACQNGTQGGEVCPPGDTNLIYSGEATPETPVNGSQATETATAPTLTKEVAVVPAGNRAVDCSAQTYTASVPTYQLGDTVCFQVSVHFAAGQTNRAPVVTDFLPANSTYVDGSEAPTSTNTATIAGFASDSSTGQLSWTLGATVPGGGSTLYVGPEANGSGRTFQADFALKPTADPTAGSPYTLTQNLAKETQLNTAGDAISLRALATYQLSRPILTLAKAVETVNGAPPNGSPPLVQDGDTVGYGVTLTNRGLEPASAVAATDALPPQVTCANVTLISDGGTCSDAASPSTISWSGLSVPAATQAASGAVTNAARTLTYDVTVPTTIGANESLTNTASVTTYQGQPNGGAPPNTYIPGTGGSPAATGSATVALQRPSLTKAATTSVTEAGNNTPSQATIGETITYTVVATVPAGSTLYGGKITDPLGPNETYNGDAVVTVAGTTTPPTSASDYTPAYDAGTNTLTVNYPPTISTPRSGAFTVTLTYSAKVANVAANKRSSKVTNTAALGYNGSSGTAQTPVNASTNVTVVEPNIAVTKSDNVSGSASPGQNVTYTVTPTDKSGTNVSTAHDLVVVDTIPPGFGVPTNITDGGVYQATPGSTTSSGTITWNLATLAPGASHPFTYDDTLPNPATAGAPLTNNVTATVASLATGGRTAGTGYAAAGSDTVTVVGPTVTKTASPAQVTIGKDTTYTAVITIPPDTRLPNYTAIDTLPDGMTFDAYGSATCQLANGSSCGSDIVDTPLGSPAAAANGTTRLAWFVGDVTDNTSARTVTLTYTAYPSKTRATGTDVVAGDVLNNSIGTYWNQTVGPDPTTIPAPSAYANASATSSAPVTVVEPDLSVLKSASTPDPQPGVPFTWTVTVANSTGATASPAYNATVVDPLPSGLGAPTDISDGGVFTPSNVTGGSPGTITWTLPGPIDPSGPAIGLTFKTDIVSPQVNTGQTITNKATISSYDGVTNASSDPSRYRTYGPTSATADVAPVFPHLVIAKSTASGAASDTATIGTPFGWKLTVTNTSTASAQGVTVVDTLPAGWSYDAGSTTLNGAHLADPTIGSDGVTLTFTLTPGTVGSSTTDVIAYTATPGPSAGVGTSHLDLNSAVAEGKDGGGYTGNGSGPYRTGPATASATIASADLAIAKTAVGDIVPGQPATYDLAVTDNGPDAAAGPITVTDTLPGGATGVTGAGTGWSCTVGGGDLTCTNPASVSAGGAAPLLTVKLTLPSSVTGSVTNSATVSSPTHDPDATNNTSSVTTPVTPEADLSIAKTHSGDFAAGQQGSYLLTVTDNGPSDASGITTVTDTLPAGETYVSATGPGWSCSAAGATVTCTTTSSVAAGSPAAGITLTVAVDSSVADGTVVTNRASVSGSQNDPDPANNTASDPTTIHASADLAIVKTHSGSFVAGTDGTYHLDVTNLGPSDAAGPVTVTDPLPAGETLVSAGGGTAPDSWSCTSDGATPPTITCTLGTTGTPLALTTGPAAPTIDLVVHLASSDTGTLANTATVASPTADPVPANNTSTTDTPGVQALADLAITKTHTGDFTAGSDGTYDLTVTNNGPSDAAGPLTVTDTLPAEETFVPGTAGGGWTCTADTTPGATVHCANPAGLASPGTTSFSIGVHVDPAYTGGTITNTATVSGPTADPDQTNNTASDPTHVVTSADLSITKTTTDPLTPGTNGTYTLTVDNHGPSDAQAATVTDDLPAGLTYVGTASGGDWACSTPSGPAGVVCTATADALPLGTTTISLEVKVDAGLTDDSITNTASVSSATPDPDTSNNTASVTTSGIAPSADLSITKSHTGDLVAGDRAEYTLEVNNNGPSDAAGPVTVTDPLPADETYVSATGDGWACQMGTSGTVTCDLAAGLPVGTAPSITLTVAVSSKAVAGSTLTNMASVSSPTADPTPANNTATDPGTVGASADLSITKTHTGDLVPGTNANYTLAIKNHGPSDVAGPVTVTDPLPAGETFVSATGGSGATAWACNAPGGGSSTGQTVICHLPGPLAADADAPAITLTVKVGGAAYPEVTNTATVSSATPDPDHANNTASDTTRVKADDNLSITKTHSGRALAGGRLTYHLGVDDHGPTLDPGPVTVTDDLPKGETVVSASGAGWTCATTKTSVICHRSGAYPVGKRTSITLVVTVGASDVPTVTNTARVAGTGTDPTEANNSASNSATVAPVANLKLAKVLDGRSLVSGSHATYTLSVTNLGPSPTSGTTTVTDRLPKGLRYVRATGDGWTCSTSGADITCHSTKVLLDGATAHISVVVAVTATSGSIINQAKVTGTVMQTTTAHDVAATPPEPVTASPLSGSIGPPRAASPPPGSPPAASYPPSASPPPGSSPTPSASPAPTGLAFTGAAVMAMLRVVAFLIGGGLALVGLARRRRRQRPGRSAPPA